MTDWSQIVAEHGPLVWQTAQRLLRHEADTADCFQRTFIAALELNEREAIRHWPAALRRLATARALEQLRQRYRDRNRFTAEANETTVDQVVDGKTIDPDQSAAAGELAERLRIALSEIDPRQAEVFCWVCLNDCSYAEAAEQLGLSSNHVGVLLNRVKTVLRERLKSYDPKLDRAAQKSGAEP
jgi:RNA polymerase sigma-70 factor, ECF subfamily